MKEGESYFYALNPEDVSIVSHDNLTLYGLFYEHPSSRGTVIFMHGHHGNPCRDFGPVLKKFKDMGFSLLLPYHRAHGKSEGNTITFGIKERRDCLSWINYVRERFGADVPIFLAGISMGAATVLMASELDLPDNVVGILADCPYSSPEAIIKKVCRDEGFPPALVYPLVRLGARLFGHFSLLDGGALESVKKSKVPIIIIHGEADLFVPCDMSRDIYKGCPEGSRLYTFEGAGHGFSFLTDEKRYGEISDDFVLGCVNSFYERRK
jgi:pimeloyl-ACP methyl ester carboxylesterase